MATVLGAGTSLATAWFLDPASRVRERLAPLPPEPPLRSPSDPASPPEEAPETLDVLARVASLLGSAAAGLTLPELRARLTESSDSLQRALAAGLRSKRLRRLGAHNKLKYVLNA